MMTKFSNAIVAVAMLLVASSGLAECFPSGKVTYPLDVTGVWEDPPLQGCSGQFETDLEDYQVQPFWVDTSGTYGFEWGGYRSLLILYADAFDAASPTANCLKSELATLVLFSDWVYFPQYLDARRQYFLVSTNIEFSPAFSAPDIWGPGGIHLETLPSSGSDLALETSTSELFPESIGETVTLSFEAENLGVESHPGVTVSHSLHPALGYVSDTCGGSLDGNVWSWSVGTLEGQVTQGCDISATYQQCRDFNHSAMVRGSQPEPLSNNRAVMSVVSPSQKPLLGGGFESGASEHWTGALIQSGVGGLWGSTGPRTGAGLLNMRPNGPHGTVASQTLLIPTSSHAFLSFWLNNLPGFDSNLGDLSVWIDDVRLAEFYPNHPVEESNFIEFCWRQHSYDISQFADGATHTLEFRNPRGSDSSLAGAYAIDDVKIEVCSDLGGDLELTLSPSATNPGLGQSTVLNLTATNLGGGVQEDVSVITSLDPSLTYISDDCGGTVQQGEWSWSVGTLANGEMQTCQIEVTYNRCREIEVTANISGSVFDLPLNNSSSSTLGAGVDVIADGGFELGNPHPHWVSTHSSDLFALLCACHPIPGTQAPLSGDVWAMLTTRSDPHSRLEQTVTIPAAQGDAFLEFWLWSRSVDGADEILQVSIDGTPVFTQVEGAMPYAEGYSRVMLDVSAWADGGSHIVELSTPIQGPAIFQIDDVALSVCQRGPVTCPGSSDPSDGDSDGVPDACDRCAEEDDFIDSDLDQVPDGCDICPGYNDAEDADLDGIPNGCDICLDVDADGFCANVDCNDNDSSNACQVFRDDFESGDLTAWSSFTP